MQEPTTKRDGRGDKDHGTDAKDTKKIIVSEPWTPGTAYAQDPKQFMEVPFTEI